MVFMIARIVNQTKTFYLIEVAVTDNRSLSTLLIKPLGDVRKDEELIQYLIKNLIFSNGSWSKTFLYNIYQKKIKHMQESYKNRASRLINLL